MDNDAADRIEKVLGELLTEYRAQSAADRERREAFDKTMQGMLGSVVEKVLSFGGPYYTGQEVAPLQQGIAARVTAVIEGTTEGGEASRQIQAIRYAKRGHVLVGISVHAPAEELPLVQVDDEIEVVVLSKLPTYLNAVDLPGAADLANPEKPAGGEAGGSTTA